MNVKKNDVYDLFLLGVELGVGFLRKVNRTFENNCHSPDGSGILYFAAALFLEGSRKIKI